MVTMVPLLRVMCPRWRAAGEQNVMVLFADVLAPETSVFTLSLVTPVPCSAPGLPVTLPVPASSGLSAAFPSAGGSTSVVSSCLGGANSMFAL